MTKPPELPKLFDSLLKHAWTEITLGQSDARVWRITLGAGNVVFLKAERQHALAELMGEYDRLSWLTTMGFKAPRIVDAAEENGFSWLLLTAVPGKDLTHYLDDPATYIRVYSQGLKRMHALDPSTCPFDHSIEARLIEAERRVTAGLVDEGDFDAERLGWTAREVLDWLRANPISEDARIVTHGDASTPNILAEDGRFSGMVDCGRVGVADVWQDLAIACRSIRDNIGEEHIAPFLKLYGAEWDAEKFRYFTTLDELF